MTQLEDFRQSTQPSVWTHINKNQLLADLEIRLEHPDRVYQSYTPLCGPAAIVYELARKHPDRYVQICRDLFEKGQFTVSGQTAHASNNLCNSRIRTGMSPADWMPMVTMREDENALFAELDDGSGDLAMGITTPWEMNGWTRMLLGYGDVEFESTFLFGEVDALEKAHDAVASGGVGFLLVNGKLIAEGEASAPFPDHWVTYVRGLNTGGDRVRFQCHTWGEIRSVDVSEEAFDDGMWGAVIGRR